MLKMITLVVFMTLAGPTMAKFIVGGDIVKGNDWENVVAITNEQGQIFCSGTAINSKTIKTAAHCLVSDETTTEILKELYPFTIALDNPGKSIEEFIKGGLTKEYAGMVIGLQELIELDADGVALEYGFPKGFFSNMKKPMFRYNYINERLVKIFNETAKKTFRIYIGNGAKGGTVSNATYKVVKAKLDSKYLEYNATMRAATVLGVNVAEIIKLKYGEKKLAPELDKLVLTLEEDLPISNYIPEITVKETRDLDYDSVRLVGFGRTVDPNIKENDTEYGVKREVTVSLITYISEYAKFVTQTPNKSACYGDSGGAAFIKLKSSGEWRYLGIISAGIGVNGVKGDKLSISKNEEDSRCGTEKIATLIVPSI